MCIRDSNKPMGVLEGTGGIADEVRDIVAKAHRGPGKIAFESDPRKLLQLVVELIDKENKDLN